MNQATENTHKCVPIYVAREACNFAVLCRDSESKQVLLQDF